MTNIIVFYAKDAGLIPIASFMRGYGETVNAEVSKTSGKPCEFESRYPHFLFAICGGGICKREVFAE